MTHWAASLPRSAAPGLGPLRFLAGAEACITDDKIWLRGNELSDADELRVRQLPGAERFQLNDRNELLPLGSLLPCGHLPAGPWQKLREFVRPELPPLRIVAGTLPSISLSLVRDSQQRDVVALLTRFESWQEYALAASQARLSPLKFAASSEGNVLIVGQPLPPLAGSLYWEDQGIYVAAGLHWSPAVSAAVVRRLLRLQTDDLAVWHATSYWELIRRSDFVAARRAAVRATGEALANVSPEVAAARAYLAPISPAYWEWEADRSAIAWRHGPTITVRQELAIVLSSPMNCALPPLTTVLILLSACRDSWPESRSVLEDVVLTLFNTVQPLEPLDQIHKLSRTHLHSPQRKAALINYLFPDRATDNSPASSVAKLLSGAGPVAQLDDLSPVNCDFRQILSSLNRALHDFDPQVFEAWWNTGLTQSVQPAEVELTAGERVRALLQQLNDDPELGGVARLARQLLAAITLPRPLAEPDDLPLGGVSDITNRGSLDRLLLSELAHDDLTLAVRIAMNEALYYRRETPPRSPPLRRMIVIDSGLRTWGVPRLFTTAIGLALSAAGDEQLAISTFRASGEQLQPIDLTRQPGLADHLAALETDLHLGQALPAIEQEYAQVTTPSDIVLITSDDALADEDFRKQLRSADLHGTWIATINREGRFRLLEFGQREMVLKREATFDLQTILTPPPRKPVAPLFTGDKNLPAFCRLQSCPLRIPHDLAVEKAWSIGDAGVLAIFKDQRLTWWDDPKRPPRILHEEMPARGRVLWADSASQHPPFRAVVGTLSNRGLHAIQVWPEEARVQRAVLQHDYTDHFSTVHGTAEHIFLIGPKRVVAFAWSGEELATSTQFIRHISGRFFHCGGPRFIGAITCEGGRIGLTSGYSLPAGLHPGALAVLGSTESPFALTHQGQLYNLLKGTAQPLEPPIGARPVSLTDVSRDRRRAVVYSHDGLQYWRVGVDPIECTKVWGDMRQIVEPKLAKFLGRQVNLRVNFRGIYVTARGELALASKKGQELTLTPSPQLLLRDTGRSQVRQPTLRLFHSVETKTGYTLQKASWDDGSEAWLDSRGLLHLRSSNLNVPEFTIVLHEGHTAAWNATGAVCGNTYFTGEEGNCIPTYVLRPLLNSFLASLVTVETT